MARCTSSLKTENKPCYTDSPVDRAGAAPARTVVMDKARNFYGAAFDGPDLSCALAGASGCGVVFRLHPAGKETGL